MDSVSGSQRPTQAETLQQQQQTGEAQKAEQVSLGYNQNNSVSHQTGGGLIALPDAVDHAPIIPEPDSSTTPTGEELATMRTQSLSSQARAGLVSSIDLIRLTQPELLTPEMEARAGGLGTMLGAIESAPEDKLKSIVETTYTLGKAALEGTLDADMLDRIMSELQTKMEDNSIKYSEIEIKSRGAEAAQKHESNAEKIQEAIDNHNEAKEKAKRKKSKGPFGLKLAIMIVFPPLLFFEAGVGIHDSITGKDSGLSMFSNKSVMHKGLTTATEETGEFFEELALETKRKTEQTGEAIAKGTQAAHDATGNAALWALGVNPNMGQETTGDHLANSLADSAKKDDNTQTGSTKPVAPTGGTKPVSPSPTQPVDGTNPTVGTSSTENTPSVDSTSQTDPNVDVTLQGLEIGQQAMSQQELMKLLLQMQAQDESSEKLAQAIAALESGDFEGAKEILSNYTGDSLGTDDLGDGLTTEAAGQQPTVQAPASDRGTDSPAGPELPPSVGEEHQAYEDAFNLTGSLSEVASQTEQAQEEQVRQNGLVRRFGAA